jgi:hypothetical protein
MTSGEVGFPSYMEEVHYEMLSGGAAAAITIHMDDAINTAHGANPYTGKSANDPATALTAIDNAVSAYDTRVDALSPQSDWESAIDAVTTKLDAKINDDTTIEADVTAFEVNLTAILDADVKPKFRAGMRDINAVQSSAFTLGLSNIDAELTRDSAKHESALRLALYTGRNEAIINSANAIITQKNFQTDSEKAVAHYTLEANRLRLVAEKEETDGNLAIAVGLAKWPLEVFQYGANLLASVHGGTSSAEPEISQIQSALGSALSGAAAGSQLGQLFGDYGAEGAGAGAFLGLLDSFN